MTIEHATPPALTYPPVGRCAISLSIRRAFAPHAVIDVLRRLNLFHGPFMGSGRSRSGFYLDGFW